MPAFSDHTDGDGGMKINLTTEREILDEDFWPWARAVMESVNPHRHDVLTNGEVF